MSVTPKIDELPDGDYAIVELFGHTTLVGRVEEVRRFGADMLAIQPLFGGQLLGPVLHGGAAIYRLTPCSREIAWGQQPTQGHQGQNRVREFLAYATAAIAAMEGWQDISTAPDKSDETTVFQVWWKCGWGNWIPLAVQWFQGDLYPQFRHGNIDWEDRIEGATHWAPLLKLTAPPQRGGAGG
jgi:hypothetical protein